LLVERAQDPGRGLWSVPGGRIEPGESDHEAVVREVAEETGLIVVPSRRLGRVQRGVYDIADYAATVVGGTLWPGSDAAAAVWVERVEFDALDLVDGLREVLAAWQALPR
jgi:8-oxo-dGTP diphosphatase